METVNYPAINLTRPYKVHTIISDEILSKYIQPHRLELGCFIIIVQGYTRITINQVEYELKPSSAITILPNNLIQILESSKDIRYEVMAFIPQLIGDIHLIPPIISNLEHIRKNPILQLTPIEIERSREFYSFFERATQWTEDNKYQNSIVQNMFMVLFYAICAMYEKYYEHFTESAFTRKEIIARDFLNLVFNNYHKERSVSYYADKLCITPAYLNAAVKEVQGLPASKVITNAVVIFAKTQLKNSTDSIKEISDKMNFPNVSFFCKFFKREVGVTPIQYRNSNC